MNLLRIWRPLVSNNVTSIRETLESNKASKSHLTIRSSDEGELVVEEFKMIKLCGKLNMWAEWCNKRCQNMCVVARKWCTYVLYSVVYNTNPLRLKKIVNRRISIHSISKYYIYQEFILCNILRNERGMKINEMAGGRVKNNGNRVDFFSFICVVYVVSSNKNEWCWTIKWDGEQSEIVLVTWYVWWTRVLHKRRREILNM